MSVAGVVVLLVVMLVTTTTTGALFSSKSRHARQTDPADISSDRLLCLFQADIEGTDGSECDAVTNTCTCVEYWRCADPGVTKPAGDNGGLMTVVNVRINGLVCDIPEQVCCKNVNPNGKLPPDKYTPGCGVRKPKGVDVNYQGFIDRQAQFGEFPWMAAVMTTQVHQRNNANFYISGASLIHPQVVLTAAHYVHDKAAGSLMVRLGEWNFKEPSESRGHQDFRVRRILVHPNFSPSRFHYDVALLFLDAEAQLGPTVDTICLPKAFEDFVGPGCYSSGWGKDSFGSTGTYQQIMKSIGLPAVDNQACQTAMRGTRLGPDFRLHSSFMCAGGEPGIDVCTGDGGSPLVCPMASDPSRYVQAGVVAWGIGCGQAGLPGVYAAVSHAVPWIQEELMNNFRFDIRLQV